LWFGVTFAACFWNHSAASTASSKVVVLTANVLRHMPLPDFLFLLETFDPPCRCLEGQPWRRELTRRCYCHCCSVRALTSRLFAHFSVNRSNVQQFITVYLPPPLPSLSPPQLHFACKHSSCFTAHRFK
jgi:hypothetical protein